MTLDPDQIQKAVDLIEKSERAAIALPTEPDLDCLASAEAICRALEAKNKTVGFFARPKFELGLDSPHELFARLAASPPLTKEFVISVNALQSPVSQMRYEKEENELRIILSPKMSAISKEAISFSEGKITCDAIIAVGISSKEELKTITGLTPEAIAETPIITIDTSPQNEKYGSANLISGSPSSFAEVAYHLITKVPGVSFDRELSTLLLTGIMYYTNSFRNHAISADSHIIASELMRGGAHYRTALELAYRCKPLELLQLFGRASVRSKINQEGDVLWSFLTEEDFRKTGRSHSDLPHVLHHLEAIFPPHELRVVLWQDSGMKDVRAMLAGNTALLETLSGRMPSAYANQRLDVTSPFQTFQEAETAITLMIKEAAADRVH